MPGHLIEKRDQPDDRDMPFERSLAVLPAQSSLRALCPPAYDQQQVKSCSAHAIAASILMIARANGRSIDLPSRLFLYYNARAREGDAATDNGASIRDALKAAADPGTCAETLWPYDPAQVLVRPSDAAYGACATKVQRYYRIERKLDELKACIAEGFAFIFGVQICQSTVESMKTTGKMLMPGAGDAVLGNHAVLAVAFDDTQQTITALNSCGPSFGDNGYLVFPYAYFEDDKLTYDFWTVREIG